MAISKHRKAILNIKVRSMILLMQPAFYIRKSIKFFTSPEKMSCVILNIKIQMVMTEQKGRKYFHLLLRTRHVTGNL